MSTECNETDAPKVRTAERIHLWLYILLAFVAIIAVLCVVIAMQPDDFKVAPRSATMAAPPAAVFEQVNDFHKWEAWSPWAKLDPNAKSTFEGPTSGKARRCHWDGNSEVGAGSMTIVESRPNELVRIQARFHPADSKARATSRSRSSRRATRRSSPGAWPARTISSPRRSAWSWIAKKWAATSSSKGWRT